MHHTQLIQLSVCVHKLFEYGLSLTFPKFFLLPEQFGNILPFAKLCDNVEVVLSFEDII